jgi:hypothetical protein
MYFQPFSTIRRGRELTLYLPYIRLEISVISRDLGVFLRV